MQRPRPGIEEDKPIAGKARPYKERGWILTWRVARGARRVACQRKA